jgi:hypothetical protein
MVTHSYCRNWQSVTSFVLQECGISAVLVKILGLYYNAKTFHFKFTYIIPNSGRNLKVTSKTMSSKNSLHNFRTRLWARKLDKKCENYVVNTVYVQSPQRTQAKHISWHCVKESFLFHESKFLCKNEQQIHGSDVVGAIRSCLIKEMGG